MSHVTRHTSHVTRHTSHITRHTSHVTRHTSHITRHTSHVTRHTSHVTHHPAGQAEFSGVCCREGRGGGGAAGGGGCSCVDVKMKMMMMVFLTIIIVMVVMMAVVMMMMLMMTTATTMMRLLHFHAVPPQYTPLSLSAAVSDAHTCPWLILSRRCCSSQLNKSQTQHISLTNTTHFMQQITNTTHFMRRGGAAHWFQTHASRVTRHAPSRFNASPAPAHPAAAARRYMLKTSQKNTGGKTSQ